MHIFHSFGDRHTPASVVGNLVIIPEVRTMRLGRGSVDFVYL